MIEFIGNKYSGWHIDLSLIPDNGTVIAAGLGNDFSFEEELIKRKNCFIVGVDPTLLTYRTVEKKRLRNLWLIRKALYITDEYTHIGGSTSNGASIYNKNRQIKIPCVTLNKLLTEFNNVSVLKMNIEGAEYEILNAIKSITIKQILVRFHHRKETVPFNKTDTLQVINKLEGFGYKTHTMSDSDNKNTDYEVLFIL